MIARLNAENVGRLLTWLLLLLIFFLLYRVVSPFFGPLSWAVIVAIFVYPLHRRILRDLRRPGLAATISLIIVIVALVLPFAWLMPAFARQAVNIGKSLPLRDMAAQVDEFLEANSHRIPVRVERLEVMVVQGLESAQGALARQSAQIAGDIAGFFFALFVMLLALFYLFRDGPRIVDLIKDISPLQGSEHDEMVDSVAEMVHVTMSSSFVVAGSQGFLGGLIFAILGLPAPVFWGVIMAVLSLLPLFGAGLIWAPAGIYLLLTGSVVKGIVLLAFGALVVGTVDNILRPILIAGRAQMNGLLILISLLGGVQVFGLLGLVLGPLVIATATGLIRGYRQSLQRPVEILVDEGAAPTEELAPAWLPEK